MSPRAHLFVVVVTLLTVGFVILLVRRHRLKSKYTLLWVTMSVLLLLIAAVPDQLDRLSEATGIDYPPATFLFAAVAFLFLIVVHFSWELSRLEERTRVLAEESALLRAANDSLADQLRALGTVSGAPSGDAAGAPTAVPPDDGAPRTSPTGASPTGAFPAGGSSVGSPAIGGDAPA
jgi:hypothetical protein